MSRQHVSVNKNWKRELQCNEARGQIHSLIFASLFRLLEDFAAVNLNFDNVKRVRNTLRKQWF